MAYVQYSRRLDCSSAYALGEGFRRGALRFTALEAPRYVDLARGEYSPRVPIEFVQLEGRTAYDMLGTDYGVLKLCSDTVIRAFEQHRLTGWATFPVRLSLKDGSVLKGYHGLAVTGRCGPIDDRFSEEVILPPLGPGGSSERGLRGLCFDPSTWDGSDVFTPQTAAAIFVTHQVMTALQNARVTNISFARLSEIERTWRSEVDRMPTGDD